MYPFNTVLRGAVLHGVKDNVVSEALCMFLFVYWCAICYIFLESTFLSTSIARIHNILGGAGHMKDLLGPEGCRNFEPHLTLTCSAHGICQSCIILSILFWFMPLCCIKYKWSSITVKYNTLILLFVATCFSSMNHHEALLYINYVFVK